VCYATVAVGEGCGGAKCRDGKRRTGPEFQVQDGEVQNRFSRRRSKYDSYIFRSVKPHCEENNGVWKSGSVDPADTME
jgi:hypothetical protein